MESEQPLRRRRFVTNTISATVRRRIWSTATSPQRAAICCGSHGQNTSSQDVPAIRWFASEMPGDNGTHSEFR
jgi:hypothetical protein